MVDSVCPSYCHLRSGSLGDGAPVPKCPLWRCTRTNRSGPFSSGPSSCSTNHCTTCSCDTTCLCTTVYLPSACSSVGYSSQMGLYPSLTSFGIFSLGLGTRTTLSRHTRSTPSLTRMKFFFGVVDTTLYGRAVIANNIRFLSHQFQKHFRTNMLGPFFHVERWRSDLFVKSLFLAFLFLALSWLLLSAV